MELQRINLIEQVLGVFMKTEFKIYLCGNIKKGIHDNGEKHYWGATEEQQILEFFGPNYSIKLLNPATIGIKRDDSFSNFGADVFLVKNSDYIFVDARNKRGIGVGGEMVIAKYYSIPVVTLCPNETDYRKSYVEDLCGENVHNWIHPFIIGLSDFIADDIQSAINWMINHGKKPQEIKDINVLETALSHFSKKQNLNFIK